MNKTINRGVKRLLSGFLICVMALGLMPGALAADGFKAEDLTLQPGSDTSEINLNWFADDTPAVTGLVSFAPAQGQAVTAEAEESDAAETGKTVCRATVTGLAPDTEYTYKVSNDGGTTWSEGYTYVTPGKGEFSFAFVGDPQLKNQNQDKNSMGFNGSGTAATDISISQGWADTLAKIDAYGVDFIASAGDQVDTTGNQTATGTGSEWEYEALFAPEQMSSLPFAAAVGNHDRHLNFLDHYNLPNVQDVSGIVNSGTTAAAKEATTAYGNYYYSYNNALFVVLNDSSYPQSVEQAKPYIEAFDQTLKAAVTAFPDCDWLFVQHHKSTESVAQHVADADIEYYVEGGFEDLMDEYSVDFVLAGHDHVYARSYAMYNGQRVSEDTDAMTDPAGTVYITCNTGSGLKYYGIFSSTGLYNKENDNYPYLADGNAGSDAYLTGVYPLSTDVAVQNYIPGYTIISVDGGQVKFTTYATYDDNNPKTSDVLDTFTVTKTGAAQSKTYGFENDEASLRAELTARYDSGVVNKDGGSTEIVVYNSDNGCAYAVNGRTGHLVKIDVSGVGGDKTAVEGMTGVHIPVKEIMKTQCPSFDYGDMTSVAVSTSTDTLAVAIQAKDYDAAGKLALFTYDGDFIAAFDTGVQPDMVTFTADGFTALTANEGEPREGTGGTDPMGSVTIVKLNAADLGSSRASTVNFTGFDSRRDALAASGVVLKAKTAPSVDLEPEYIATYRNTAYVSLQEANSIAVLDLNTQTFTGIYSLGLQDYSKTAIDLLKDGNTDIKTQPGVYGIKMPDGISVYASGGKTYILTANEGDSRSDWKGLDNEVEGTKSPTGKVETTEDVVWFDAAQYDGLDQTKAYIFGGRSFSIYQVDGAGLTPVFDSGSGFEEITAQVLPGFFNCSNDKISADNRSGKKGPEPENITVGTVGARTYAFIALERIGGIMVYDITDLSNSSYVNYINSRDFSAKIAGDVSPEGLAFVPAYQSTTGKAMLLTANEVSGTVCAYTMTAAPVNLASRYDIQAYVGQGGTVTPSGTTAVIKGESQSYTIKPDEGYEIADVLVDGKSVGAVSSYTFSNVKEKHSISVSFKKAAAAWKNPFTDVSQDKWFYSAVQFVSEAGLMNGTSSDKFSPDKTVSRGMITAVLYRLDKGSASGSNPFSDVPESAYYRDAIVWASANKIVSGYGDGRFGPDDAVTREQLAAILYRYAQFKGYSVTGSKALTGYTDAGSVSAYAAEAMGWAVGTGIIGGTSSVTLSPKGSATRAQTAAILQRFCASVIK